MTTIHLNRRNEAADEIATTLLPNDLIAMFSEAGRSATGGGGSETLARENPPQMAELRYVTGYYYRGRHNSGETTYGGQMKTDAANRLYMCNFLNSGGVNAGLPNSTTTTPSTTNTARWFHILTGSISKGAWSSRPADGALRGEVWENGGAHYLSKVDTTQTPSDTAGDWIRLTPVIHWRGEFSAGTTYYTEDYTTFRQRLFYRSGGPTTIPPQPNAAGWHMVQADAIIVDSDGDVGIGTTPVVGSPLSVQIDAAHNLGLVLEHPSGVAGAGELHGMTLKRGTTRYVDLGINEQGEAVLFGRNKLDFYTDPNTPYSSTEADFIRVQKTEFGDNPALKWIHMDSEVGRVEGRRAVGVSQGVLFARSRGSIVFEASADPVSNSGLAHWWIAQENIFLGEDGTPSNAKGSLIPNSIVPVDIGGPRNRVRKLYVDDIDLTNGDFLPANPPRTSFLRSDGNDPFWGQAGHWARGDIEGVGSLAGVQTSTRFTSFAIDPLNHDQWIAIDGHNNRLWYRGEGGTTTVLTNPLPADPPWLESGHDIYMIGGCSILEDGVAVIACYAGERELVDGEYLYRVGAGHGRWVIYLYRLRARGDGGSTRNTPATVGQGRYVRPFRNPTTPNEANFDPAGLWATTGRQLGSESPTANPGDIVYFMHCNDTVHTPALTGYCAVVFNTAAYTSPNTVTTGPINRSRSRHVVGDPMLTWGARVGFRAVADDGDYSYWLRNDGSIDVATTFRNLLDEGIGNGSNTGGLTGFERWREFDMAAITASGHEFRAFDKIPRGNTPGDLRLLEYGGDREILNIERRLDLFDNLMGVQVAGTGQQGFPIWMHLGHDDDPRLGIGRDLDVALNVKASGSHLTVARFDGHGDEGSRAPDVQLVLGQDNTAGNPGAGIRTTQQHALEFITAVGSAVIPAGQGDIRFRRGDTTLWEMEADGNLLPGDDDSQSLGSSTRRLDECWSRTANHRIVRAEASNGPLIFGAGGDTGEIFFQLQVGSDIRPSGSGKSLGDSANQWDSVHAREVRASDAAGTLGLGYLYGAPVLPVFADSAARDVGLPSPQNGTVAHVGADVQRYNGSAWEKVGGTGIVTSIPDVPWTAVPASIIPDSAGGRDLGNSGFYWGHGFFGHIQGPGSPAFLTIDRSTYTGRTLFPQQVFPQGGGDPNVSVEGVLRGLSHSITASGEIKIVGRDDSTSTQVGSAAQITRSQLRTAIASTNTSAPSVGDIPHWGAGNTLTWSPASGLSGSLTIEDIPSGASQGGTRINLGASHVDIAPQRFARGLSWSIAASNLEDDRVLQVRQRGQVDARQITDVLRDATEEFDFGHHIRVQPRGGSSDATISHSEDHDTGLHWPSAGAVSIATSGADMRIRGGNATSSANINQELLPDLRSDSEWNLHQSVIGGSDTANLWNKLYVHDVEASVVAQPSARATKFRISPLTYADAQAALSSLKVRSFRRKREPDVNTVGSVIEEFTSGSSGTLLERTGTVNTTDLVWYLARIIQTQARRLEQLRLHFGSLLGQSAPDWNAEPAEAVSDRGTPPPGYTN